MSKNIILATDKYGKEITISQVENWIANKEKNKLATLVIMANCCLLIEAFISFKELGLKSTYRNSERCFGIFFTTEDRFMF